jgi:quercetin 2,3-dioxygenase
MDLPTALLHDRPGQPWLTADPFLFAVHHVDRYPAGDSTMALPITARVGRHLGQDFAGRDGFSMYHGRSVPGFPQHPHRGFETITIVRQGFVDHADSLGATARIGPGDVQWMTAGAGIVHSEMFPLLSDRESNPVDFFQLWINLPARNKMIAPHFTMQWAESVPMLQSNVGGASTVKIYAGDWRSLPSPVVPPHSYAAQTQAAVSIATVAMQPGSVVEIPRASHPDATRLLYFFGGKQLSLGKQTVRVGSVIQLSPDVTMIENGEVAADCLLLGGRAIGEPVVAHGPFVMNTKQEIAQAVADYQRTQFGGWPWPSDDPVHGRERGRFAKHPDGRLDFPPMAKI